MFSSEITIACYCLNPTCICGVCVCVCVCVCLQFTFATNTATIIGGTLVGQDVQMRAAAAFFYSFSMTVQSLHTYRQYTTITYSHICMCCVH